MAVDIINELKRQKISSEYLPDKKSLKFVKDGKTVVFDMSTIEMFLMQALVQRIDFQINLLD